MKINVVVLRIFFLLESVHIQLEEINRPAKNTTYLTDEGREVPVLEKIWEDSFGEFSGLFDDDRSAIAAPRDIFIVVAAL